MLKPVALGLSLLLSLSASINCQQTTTATPQAATVLAQSLAALGGSSSVSDITLTGTVERIVGSDDEMGTVTYRAISTANRMDLGLSGGTRSEIRAMGANGPVGNWIGPDGTVHEISLHNLLTDSGWFPPFTLSNILSGANSVLTYVGPETRGGTSVIHLQTSQQQPYLSASAAQLNQHLAQMDIYLDASTQLPFALAYSTHADSNALLDIPVEFRFYNYQQVGSLNIPFRVQEFFNGTLFLNVQFQHASVNSGLSASSSIFNIQ